MSFAGGFVPAQGNMQRFVEDTPKTTVELSVSCKELRESKTVLIRHGRRKLSLITDSRRDSF